ncbi:hypothetical protein Tco_1008961, partial [Tanacetum coccineum]
DHKWYDELTDGVLKEEALMHKAKFKDSWGNASPGVMKFCTWLKNSFEKFHELDRDVLVKLEECWNHGANNVGSTQDNLGPKEQHDEDRHKLFSNPAHEPPVCNIRGFAMTKYSFKADEEYVAIEEDEYADLARTDVDACRAYHEMLKYGVSLGLGYGVLDPCTDLAVKKSTNW